MGITGILLANVILGLLGAWVYPLHIKNNFKEGFRNLEQIV